MSSKPTRPDPLLPIEAFAAAIPSRGRLIGLDLGTKTIGLAVCDPDRRIASPLETIRRTKFTDDAATLLAICGRERVVGLIIGLPLNMDGSEGPRVQATRAFVRNLAPLTSLPIAAWDERLSTAAVTRRLIDLDTSRAKRAELVDMMAAAYILEGAIDRLARLRDEPAEDAP